MNKYMQEAKAIRASIDGLAANQTDETLVDNKAAFELWRARINAEKGKIYRYGDDIYKCIQAHTTQDDWTPDKVPALFAKISLEEYPEWVQPTGAHDAYKQGDKVTFDNKHWVSTVNDNVWQPGVYGWNEGAE